MKLPDLLTDDAKRREMLGVKPQFPTVYGLWMRNPGSWHWVGWIERSSGQAYRTLWSDEEPVMHWLDETTKTTVYLDKTSCFIVIEELDPVAYLLEVVR